MYTYNIVINSHPRLRTLVFNSFSGSDSNIAACLPTTSVHALRGLQHVSSRVCMCTLVQYGGYLWFSSCGTGYLFTWWVLCSLLLHEFFVSRLLVTYLIMHTELEICILQTSWENGTSCPHVFLGEGRTGCMPGCGLHNAERWSLQLDRRRCTEYHLVDFGLHETSHTSTSIAVHCRTTQRGAHPPLHIVKFTNDGPCHVNTQA